MSLPQTTNRNPPDAIKELLNGYEGWSLGQPKVQLLQETSQSERGPGQGQPAEMYLWMDGGMDLPVFSADGDHWDASGDIDIWIITLENGKLGEDNQVYMNETVQFLSEYINDNEQNSIFHRIRPSNADDQRAEHITGTTDHHASVVTVSVREFRETGL